MTNPKVRKPGPRFEESEGGRVHSLVSTLKNDPLNWGPRTPGAPSGYARELLRGSTKG